MSPGNFFYRNMLPLDLEWSKFAGDCELILIKIPAKDEAEACEFKKRYIAGNKHVHPDRISTRQVDGGIWYVQIEQPTKEDK